MSEIILVPQLFNDKLLLQNLKNELAERFNSDIQIQKQLLYFIRSFDESREQYNAAEILKPFQDYDHQKSLIITAVDLFIPIFSHVFGLAKLNGSAAIVSTHRLNNKFYGLPKNHQLLMERTLKEVVHELGHSYGLKHCRQYECVMASSTTADDLDIKSDQFCKECSLVISDHLK